MTTTPNGPSLNALRLTGAIGAGDLVTSFTDRRVPADSIWGYLARRDSLCRLIADARAAQSEWHIRRFLGELHDHDDRYAAATSHDHMVATRRATW